MDELAWLMDWYASECNGDWEHQYGVAIETLDNPGWSIRIDLAETALTDRAFAIVSQDGDASWWHCSIRDGIWTGACGPRDLPRVLSLFREWATTPARP
ncbi:MAG TPA: immunity 53 family protein [Rhizomicrobium sp.]|nr:immunity 53 family protein [Rhizomicrobium sp.]